MRIKFILPALAEATLPGYRPIKYSLFPPLGLATLAGYCDDRDEITLTDEHTGPVELDDDPELVAIQVYVTSAFRAYELADHYRRCGVHVCLGGLHVTSCPDEAAAHADTIFLGPGEDTWPRFLADFRQGKPQSRYWSKRRDLVGMPRPRRDLIARSRYLAPNSIVVSRGCPHACDFCYKQSFFAGGRSFYTQRVDAALQEIESLPGRHLFFLDDNLFGDPAFADRLFAGMKGMGRVWQGAATVGVVQRPELLQRAVDSGLRSLFIGFETLSAQNLASQHKKQNLNRDYGAVIQRLQEFGVMINGSFIFGLPEDDTEVFSRTVDWAVANGIETATFHLLTPYPGTALFDRMQDSGTLLTRNWDLFDTRHAVFRHGKMTPTAMERGYWRAYRDFYSWSSIWSSARSKADKKASLRHLAYTSGWKKFEPVWDFIVRHGWLPPMSRVLEKVLETGCFWKSGVGRKDRNRS